MNYGLSPLIFLMMELIVVSDRIETEVFDTGLCVL